MDAVTLIHSSEFAGAIIIGLLDIALVVVLFYAYSRCRKASFLLLAAGTFGFLYMNFFAAVVAVYSISHFRVFSPPTMRVLSAFYAFVGPLGGVLWFIGGVSLIRFTLSLHATRQT